MNWIVYLQFHGFCYANGVPLPATLFHLYAYFPNSYLRRSQVLLQKKNIQAIHSVSKPSPVACIPSQRIYMRLIFFKFFKNKIITRSTELFQIITWWNKWNVVGAGFSSESKGATLLIKQINRKKYTKADCKIFAYFFLGEHCVVFLLMLFTCCFFSPYLPVTTNDTCSPNEASR